MKLKRLAIMGSGGLAREVEWLVRDLNRVTPTWEFVGYVVSDLSRLGEYDSKAQVRGDYQSLRDGVDAVAIGIGTPASRLKVAAEVKALYPALEWPVLVHPSARIDFDSATLGPGAIVAAGVIATVNLVLGAHAFVNLACTIGHEATIGEGCVVNPSVNLSGGVKLGAGVLVGTGAQVLQYLEVGAGATIGAGAVVTKNVEAGTTVVGMPARPRS
ncbi:MAG TPA: hypothetical protein VGE37_04800 [Archangium sp.]